MRKIILIVAACLIATFPAFAQDMKMDKMRGQGMQDGMMRGMMADPHHKLGMAYMQNLRNFARTLKTDITATGKVDKDFAVTAVNEMKQSYKQMMKHHDEMMQSMPEEKKNMMKDMMEMKNNRMKTTEQHLDALEKEVKMENPDPKKVIAEIDQVLKQCEMMRTMHREQKRSGSTGQGKR